MTRCVGHRGAAGLAPENTLASFRAGIAAGADLVECDVHRTLDGHLVLMHDADVRRTTDGQGRIGTMVLSELQRLNCAARFGDGTFPRQQIPTLGDLLSLAQGRCAVQIEIKVPDRRPYPGIEAQVIGELREHTAVGSAQVICFDPATLARLHALEPRVTLGYLASKNSVPPALQTDPVALVKDAAHCGAAFLSLDWQFATPAHVRAARDHHLGLAVWTINDCAEMERFRKAGVDAITSDFPDLLRQVLTAGTAPR